MVSKTYVLGHENNGGGQKPITRRQIIKIEKLARQLNTSAWSLAIEVYKKTISELSGYEAHELIKKLEVQLK